MSMKRLALAMLIILLSATLSFAASITVYQDTMDSASGGWTATGLWHVAADGDPCPNSHSGNESWYYGNSSCNYDTGKSNAGSLTSPVIHIPADGVDALLTFWYYYQTESGVIFDIRRVQVSLDGGPFADLKQLSSDPMNTWNKAGIDVSAYAGHDVQFRFYFDTVDSILNFYKGWYVDDVMVTYTAPPYNSFLPSTYSWIETATTGTSIFTSNTDDNGIVVPIGFNFTYFGNTYSTIGVSSNGYLSFGPVLWPWGNTDIPQGSDPNNIIAPFWDDLYIYPGKAGGGGNVYYQTLGSAPNRIFVVQYNNVDFCCAVPDNGKLYFEVILSEADGSIMYQYKNMTQVNTGRGTGNSATIGVENSSGTYGVMHSFNTEGAVSNGMAIRLKFVDSDGDGVPDVWENALGTNPLVSDAPTTVVTFAGPGVAFGTAYFKFDVAALDPATTGFRVFYGAGHNSTYSTYDAYFDMYDSSIREGYVDQKWGMQGVPMVFFRVAPITTVNGRTFIGTPSNELSTYFAGSEPKKDMEEDKTAGIGITTTMNETNVLGTKVNCFIATAAFGSPDAAPVTWLRKFRDGYLLTSAPGRWFVDVYYKVSPPVADFVARHAWARAAVKLLLAPAVAASWVLVEAPLSVRLLFLVLVVGCTVVMVRFVMARRREQA